MKRESRSSISAGQPQAGLFKRQYKLSTLACVSGILCSLFIMSWPIANLATLIEHTVYGHFVGTGVAWGALWGIVGVTLLCALMMVMFHSNVTAVYRTEQSWMFMAHSLITLFGFTLLLLSIPIGNSAINPVADITGRCTTAEGTEDLFQYWAVLNNIRQKPSCMVEATVEDCEGYEANEDFTDFIKSVEAEYRCSGFCLEKAKTTERGETRTEAPAAPAPAGVAVEGEGRTTQATVAMTQHGRKLSFAQKSLQTTHENAPYKAPKLQAIFTRSKYHIPCDGIMASDLRAVSQNVSGSMYFQGMGFLLLAVFSSLLKLLTMTANKDNGLYGGGFAQRTFQPSA